MNRIDTILNNLEANAKDFKIDCDVSVLSDVIDEELKRAITKGVQIQDNIQEALDYLGNIRLRLLVTAPVEEASDED